MRISDWSSDVCSSDLSRRTGMSLAIDHFSDGHHAAGSHDEAPLRQPVVLRGRPLVGHLPELRVDPLRFFTRIARDHGDAVELRFGLDKVLMLNEPEMIRHVLRSEEHTSELQSLMRISYAVFCLKKNKTNNKIHRKN